MLSRINQPDWLWGNYYIAGFVAAQSWHQHIDTLGTVLRTPLEMRLCAVFWLPVKKQASDHRSVVI